jgi:hypothetical protein
MTELSTCWEPDSEYTTEFQKAYNRISDDGNAILGYANCQNGRSVKLDVTNPDDGGRIAEIRWYSTDAESSPSKGVVVGKYYQRHVRNMRGLLPQFRTLIECVPKDADLVERLLYCVEKESARLAR